MTRHALSTWLLAPAALIAFTSIVLAADDIAKEFADKGLIVLAVDVLEADQKVKKYLADHPLLRSHRAHEGYKSRGYV
jgi:hypothetical protein